MQLEQIKKTLHPFECTIIPLLLNTRLYSELLAKSGLRDVEIMRALEWLENKKLITREKQEAHIIVLGANGILYRKEGLPERRILQAVQKKSLSLDELRSITNCSSEEINVSLGTLRRLQAIILTKEKGTVVGITASGKLLVAKETAEEQFLKQKFPIPLETLRDENKFTYEQLRSRKDILVVKDDKDWMIDLTPLGKELAASGVAGQELLGRVTSSLIRAGTWKKQDFRSYDVAINVPPIFPGKRHSVTQAIDYIKRIWLELGFKEMRGNIIHTAFWDLDALFVPQDHPARDMQDTFYLANPGSGSLPQLAKKIKRVHETGEGTGSTGWGGTWDSTEAQQLLLRTHTTVLSAQTIARLKESDLPAKFFAVGKVFRNETLDYSHLFEFYQVEGIVIDPQANFRHLKGYLKEFYKKMGYSDVRIRPAHFPYTEPSCEVEVFHPIKQKWLELGGAGIFRPEVVIPLLGKDVPVLAWGLGLDRIISSYYALSDIRDLYKNDLQQLREAKLWVR